MTFDVKGAYITQSKYVIPVQTGIQHLAFLRILHDGAFILLSMKQYYVYILTSGYNGTLYIGVTSNLEKRLDQHTSKKVDGFTAKYHVDRLVWYESTTDVLVAIEREKQLKKWNRAWKIRLIEETNPGWEDLSEKF